MKLENVPVIDISPFWSGTPADRKRIADQVDRAVKDIGFLVVSGHSVPKAIMDEVDAACRAFFDLPMEVKERSRNKVRGSFRGYMPYGEEALAYTLGEKAPPDIKEGFQMGRPYFKDNEDYSPEVWQVLYTPNVWPPELPRLEQALTGYYRELDRLTQALLQIFALALRLPEDFFVSKFDRPASVIRAINYPAQDTAPEPGQIRAGAHTDYSILTILRADKSAGGLQVKNFNEEWVDVPLVEDTFIINIGDQMMRWTNDVWLSNLHRVVNPPAGAGLSARRQSIAFFANPNPETVVECIPTCVSAERPAKYPPTLAMQSRLDKIFKSVDQDAKP